MGALTSDRESSFHAALREAVDAAREHWSAGFDRKELRWLALLPEWTESLAEACEFPAKDGIEVMIERAEASHLCETMRRRDDGRETVRFWMSDAMREWLFDRWETDDGVQLESDASEVAMRIIGAHRKGVEVSPGILRWAHLARDELSQPVVTGEFLSRCVRSSLSERDLASAGEWLFAGEWLSRPLGAQMETAAARARRQISLYYLRRQDADYLKHFLPRAEQIAELKKLADSAGDEWAVHFIGPSGVGKTMLMRFVTGGEDSPFGRASRVDFDYLDPRIPLERPARLLQGLAEGFANDLEDGAQESLFQSFLEAVMRAEGVRAKFGFQEPGLASGSEEFEDAIESFAAFLRELPGPVVLVLDTCEELAKLHPPGGRMWSVDATLDILERLRPLVPGLKLIVSGRRWVTSAYANHTRELPAPAEVMNAPPRRFMEFHPTRGFSETEVRSYLRDVCELELDEDLIEATLANTIDTASVPGVEGKVGRFHSPNDVAFVAKSLRADPVGGRRALTEGNFDPYVKERILDRLGREPGVSATIPAAALLGRFDSATIEPMLGADPAGRSRVLAGLLGEDWTHLEGDPEPEKTVIRVDEGLLPRLRTYYDRTAERRQERERARDTLCRHLAAKLEEAPRPTVEVVDAAARLLPPEELVAKLDLAFERAVDARAWEWAEAVGARLLHPEREPALPTMAHATAWSLYLTGIKHSQATMDLSPLWESVAEMAADHPDRERGAVLAIRSRLAALAAGRNAERIDLEETAALFSRGRYLLRREQAPLKPVSSLLAAAERLVDEREARGVEIPVKEIVSSLEEVAKLFEGSTELQAYVLAQIGRMHALHGEAEAATTAFSHVALMPPSPNEKARSFADWEAPSSMASRATLELLRFRLATREENEGLLDRCEEIAYRSEKGADSAQLLSLVLRARMATGTLSQEQVATAASYEHWLGMYELRSPAHRAAPQLFVTVAEAWFAVGEVEPALELLEEREGIATSRRNDEETARAAALARLKILRRLRLREALALASHPSAVDDELRAEGMAAGALIAGLQPTPNPRQADDHATWRVRNLLDGGEAEVLLSSGRGEQMGSPGSTDVQAPLDLLESELVRRRWQGWPYGVRHAARIRRRLEEEMPDRPDMPSLEEPLAEEGARVWLRLWALMTDRVPPIVELRPGQVATVALEEGELLALRVPDRADRLFALAVECFDQIGDPFGAFTAELRRAIAEIHVGRVSEARQRRREILRRYEELRQRRESLPALAPLAERETGELIDPDDPWRGWIWRLATYMKWCDGHAQRSGMEAVAMEFGPEFALRPARAARGVDGVLLRPGRSRRLRESARGPLRWLSLGVAGAAVLTLGPLIGWALALAAVSALAVAVVAVVVVEPRLPRQVIPFSAFDISVLSLPGMGQAPAYALAATQPRARLALVRDYLRSRRRRRLPTYWAVPARREVKGHELPVNVRAVVRRALNGEYRPLRLAIPSDLATIGWERILLAGLVERPSWTPLDSPRIRRVRPSGFPSPPPHWNNEAVAVCSRRWRKFLEKSTRGELRWLSDMRPLGALPRRQSVLDASEQRGRGRAAIALGTPVVTRAGWRLRLDEDVLTEPLRDPSEPRPQKLVRPERLAREFAVTVLAGRPGGPRPTVDRQVSEGLRGLANEIFLAGAHAVITIPVLPPRIASEVIGLVAAAIESWESAPDEEQLQDCVREARSCVFDRTRGTDSGEAERLRSAELALDVCLYAPSPRGGS